MKKNKRGNDIFQSIIHPIMFGLYKLIIGPIICKLMFNVRTEGLKLSKIKGSYMLLGNHVTNYDGLFFQQHAGQIISFISNERLFRLKLVGPLMKWTHFIPKKKFSNDLKAVRHLFAAKQQGRVIGIFPEGRRCWDGCTTPIVNSIASLVKSLKIPVVVGLIKGGFSSEPRWAGERRKGKVIIEYKQILSEDDIRAMDTEKLLTEIKKGIDYKEHDYLQDKNIFFKTKNPSLGLERLCYICPKCKQIGTLISSDTDIECSCGHKASFNNYGKLTSEYFSNLEEWNNWQRNELSLIKHQKSNSLVFEDVNVTLSGTPSSSYEPYQQIDFGSAKLFRDKIVFAGEKTYEFPVVGLWGCNIQKNNGFEFSSEKTTYLFTMNGRDSAYKWSSYMEL